MIQKISGEVIHGNALGRTIGFPTANIAYTKSDIWNSVFQINIIIWAEIFSWIWANMVSKWIFEAHIFNFSEDIYGKNIEIILLKKIRDNQKFNSLEEIKNQISKDQEIAKTTKLPVLTFGSFDVTHPGHSYYLSEAKKYGTHLITIIATDKNIEKIKWKSPRNTQKQRFQELWELWISDEIIMGSEESPLSWIEKLQPHVICLWYDQRWIFVDALPEKISELWLSTEIIRIPAFHPEKYKSSILKEEIISKG